MSYGDPIGMLLNYIPRVLNWLVLAAIIVGVIIGMRRRPHWSCVVMLCGMCLVLLISVASAAVFQLYILRRQGSGDMRLYSIISSSLSFLSILGNAAFAAGFIVRMAVAKRRDVPTVLPA